MQRCRFFIILLGAALQAFAQPVRIAKSEVSFWFKGLQQAEVPARAEINFVALADSSSLVLDAKDLKVTEVRLKEGRLKDHLPFHQSGGQLVIDLPQGIQAGTAYSLNIAYHLKYDSTAHRFNWLNAPLYTAFNPFNVQMEESLGKSGSFYPSRSGQASLLKFNITLPKGTRLRLPGLPEFLTDNQDGSISHYWKTTAPLAPESFYLVIGDFEEEELIAIQENLQFEGINSDKLTARKVEARVSEAEKALGISDLSDSEYVRIDSLAELVPPEYFITQKDLPGISPDQFRLTEVMFMEYGDGNAEKRLYDFYRKSIGEAWHRKILQEKWEQYESLPADEKRMSMRLYLEAFHHDNPFLDNLDSSKLREGFFDPMLSSLNRPVVQVEYRYIGADDQLLAIVKQDTSQAPAYALPARAYLIGRNDSLFATDILNQSIDTLRIPATGAPYYAHLDFGDNFPGKVEQNKPDTYWLHLLANAVDEQKTMALRQLFKTSNKNLLSTVLGIAMDDPEAEIRLEALQNLDKLNRAGLEKLRDSIRQMAEKDTSTEVREMAQKVLSKYYTAK